MYKSENLSVFPKFMKIKRKCGTSLVIQWFETLSFNASGAGLIPDWDARIPNILQQKKKKKHTKMQKQNNIQKNSIDFKNGSHF